MTPTINTISLLGIACSGIGVFLGTFYLVRNKFSNDGYLFLYLMIGLLSYELFYKTLIQSQLIYDYIFLYAPGRYYNLIIYPIFLFFVYSITRKEFRFNRIHWGILAVFVLYTCSASWQAFSLTIEEKQAMLNLFYEDNRPGPVNYWMNWEAVLQSTLIPVLFVGIIGYEFFRFKKRIPDTKTMRLASILAIIIWVYFIFGQFGNLIYKGFYSFTSYSMIEWPVDIGFLAIIISLLSIIALSVNSGSSLLPASKYASSSLDSSSYAGIIADLTALLQEEKVYKQPGLTLQKAAKMIDSNPSYLSQAINHHLDISFLELISKYRVEEAKKELVDMENAHLTLEAIAQQCGFNSKSTFFRTFKKTIGMTPKQFIEQQNGAN